MSLHPEPNVTSCNGVCNARILCVASVPAYSSSATEENSASKRKEEKQQGVGSYTQKLRDYRKSISPSAQPASELTPSALATPEKKKLSATLPVVGNGPDAASNSDTQLDLNLSSSDDEPDVAVAATLEQRMPSPAPSLHTTYHMQQVSTSIAYMYIPMTYIIITIAFDVHYCTLFIYRTLTPRKVNAISRQCGLVLKMDAFTSTTVLTTFVLRRTVLRLNIIQQFSLFCKHCITYNIRFQAFILYFYFRYLDNRVFVSLANGDICVYLRDGGKLGIIINCMH